MYNKLRSLFGNKQKIYKSCSYIHGGITFMNSLITVCNHTSKCGVKFIEDYKGQPIKWNVINKKRKAIISKCKKGVLPVKCNNCINLKEVQWDDIPLIDNISFHHWDNCNCSCIYCKTESYKRYETKYNAYEHLKYLYDKKMVSKNVHIDFSGGDIAGLEEAENIIKLCLEYGVGKISFHSSCIKYSYAIEKALCEAPNVVFDISLDCTSRDLYQKIKGIDEFNQVIENIKQYITCSANKQTNTLVAKYIILDGINDNIEELDKWIDLMYQIGIRNTKLEVNFKRFYSDCYHTNPVVPQYYYQLFEHYNEKIEQLEIKDYMGEFTKQVLKNGGTPIGY